MTLIAFIVAAGAMVGLGLILLGLTGHSGIAVTHDKPAAQAGAAAVHGSVRAVASYPVGLVALRLTALHVQL